MSNKSPEPEVYSQNTESLIQGLDNMNEMTPEEIKSYRKRIDSTRIAIPKKAKKKKDATPE